MSEKAIFRIVMAVSMAVFLLVIMLNRKLFPPPAEIPASFPTGNPVRPLYLFILSSHIILAAVVLPLILLSFYHGLKNNVAKHRKLTRWSFPIWLYVTVTGVVVYLMISPYYQFG